MTVNKHVYRRKTKIILGEHLNTKLKVTVRIKKKKKKTQRRTDAYIVFKFNFCLGMTLNDHWDPENSPGVNHAHRNFAMFTQEQKTNKNCIN